MREVTGTSCTPNKFDSRRLHNDCAPVRIVDGSGAHQVPIDLGGDLRARLIASVAQPAGPSPREVRRVIGRFVALGLAAVVAAAVAGAAAELAGDVRETRLLVERCRR